MSLPKVSIEIASGGLGRTPSLLDGISALLITGSKTKIASASDTLYSAPTALYAYADIKKLNLDTVGEQNVYAQVQDFYNQAGKGSQLWLMLVAKDRPFSELFAEGGPCDTLASEAKGEIRLLGVSHAERTGSNLKSAVNGLKGNVHAAVPLAQGYATRMQALAQPLQIILAGNEVSSLTDLSSYSTGTNTHVSLLIGGKKKESKETALGFTIGLLSRLPVQRSLARVKNGALSIAEATFSNGDRVESHSGQFESLHEKRYLFFRNYTGLAGYYIADDLNLNTETADTSNIATQRVLDKAIRLVRKIYVEEIAEEVLLEDGKLSRANIKYLEGKIENALNEAMTNRAEISTVEAFIDPEQNVLSTDRLDVSLSITPIGYTKKISIDIGLTNPKNG